MDLKEELLGDRSKEHVANLASHIIQNPQEFDVLWDMINHGESPLPERAAWVLSHVGDTRADLLIPHFPDVMPLLNKEVHNSIHRGLTRTLAKLQIPEEIEGEMYDLMLAWIASPAQKIAIRVFAMEIVANIAAPYPELCGEVAQVIKAQMGWGSAGYKSRAKRILKRLARGA